MSDSLAEERTYLAWLRTGMASMGFGFVVARFGLFLQEIQLAKEVTQREAFGRSVWFGTALIATGVAVCLLASWRHLTLVQDFRLGRDVSSYPSAKAVWLGVLLVLVGAAMAIYLVETRKTSRTEIGKGEGAQMTLATTSRGVVDIASNHSVDETVDRLKGLLQSKGITLFALVDHAGEATRVGLKMPPTKLLVLGSPKAGTPLMLAAPRVAIDLPLKILVWEDMNGKVWISYNAPEYLKERHGLSQALLANIAGAEALATKAAE